MHRIMLFLLAGLTALATTGCLTAGLVEREARYRLEEDQRTYTQSLRWGQINQASTFVDEDMRDEFLDAFENFDDIRFTEYHISGVKIEDDINTASVKVSYKFYRLSTLVEKSFREVQQWHRDVDRNVWLIRPNLEELRLALIGVSN